MVAAHKNRKNPRAQVSLVARYRSPTAFDFVAEECHDLSAGGMFIRSPAPAPAGTLLKLECDVDRGQAAIRAVARVVWLREQDSQGEPAGMGVKFVKIEPGGREILDQLLARLGGTEGAGPEARGSIPAPPPAAADQASHASEVASERERAPVEEVRTQAAAPAQPARAAETAPLAPEVEPEEQPARQERPAQQEPSAQIERPAPEKRPAAEARPAQEARAESTVRSAAVKPAAPKRSAADANRTPVMVGAALLFGVVVISLFGRKERPPEPIDAPSSAAAPEHEPSAAAPSDSLGVRSAEPATAPAPRFVLQLTTIPDAARVQIGQQQVVTPSTLDLGTLSAPIEVRAEKDGFEPVTATIELDRFSVRDGQRVATVTLALPPLPREEAPAAPVAAAPPAAPAAPVAAATPEPAKPAPKKASPPPSAPAVREPKRASAAAAAAAPAPAPASEAKPQEAPAPKPPESEAAADKPKETPMQAAMACLARGDNPCVVDALEGKARAAGELELLIETYRAMGNSGAAERHMATFVEKFPSERRAAGYRRLLHLDAPPAAAAPAP